MIKIKENGAIVKVDAIVSTIRRRQTYRDQEKSVRLQEETFLCFTLWRRDRDTKRCRGPLGIHKLSPMPFLDR